MIRGSRKFVVRTALGLAVLGGATVVGVVGSGHGKATRPATHAMLLPNGSSGSVQLAATPKAPATYGNPVVSYAKPAISPPLRDLPQTPSHATASQPESRTPETRGPTSPPARDGALQTSAPTAVMDPPLITFDGASNRDNFVTSSNHNSSRPPDNDGDVGPQHYVEWINTVIDVFGKSGNVLPGFPKSGEQLFQNLHQQPVPGQDDVCKTENDGDPLVLYDQLADRWVLTQFAFMPDPVGVTGVAPPFEQCVAVSTSPDPTGTYCTYAFLISGESFNDYPKIGMRPDGYYFSFNMFAGGLAAPGAGMAWVDRNAMLGCQTAASVVFTPATNPALAGTFGFLPADMDGTTPPPAGEPEFYVSLGAVMSNSLDMWKFNVDTSNPSASTFSGPYNIAVNSFSSAPGSVPQKDTPNQLDSLSDRLMNRLVYRNWGTSPPNGIPPNTESLVVNHSVNVSGHSGVRWYEIRNPDAALPAGPTVFQQATWSPDAKYRWMGSAAMDGRGDLAVGYSTSSSGMYPAIRYAGRLREDSLNTLRDEASIVEGGGPAPVATATTGDPRWGDYTSLNIDPVDDCTFWYVNEYYKDTTKIPEDTAAALTRWWRTKIGAFKFSECGSPTAVVVKRFGAQWRGRGVTVSWRTATETTALGFNVYRSVGAGPFRKLNRALIPAKRLGSTGGAAYSLTDRAVKQVQTYTYRLQMVERSGKRSFYGIGSAATRF